MTGVQTCALPIYACDGGIAARIRPEPIDRLCREGDEATIGQKGRRPCQTGRIALQSLGCSNFHDVAFWLMDQ